MTQRSKTRRLLAAAALLFVSAGVAACGDDDAVTVTEDAVVGDAQPGAGGGAAGTCLEGTPDCEDTPMDPDQPVSDSADPPADDQEGGFPTEEAREEARALLGVPEDELRPEVRVARRGEESMMLTEDYVLGRITVELDDDGSGTYVVVSAVVELPDGPETFTA